MKRIATLLLISALFTLMIHPVSPQANSSLGNNNLQAEGAGPAPPFPPMMAEGAGPAPPFPPMMAEGAGPAPPFPPMMAEPASPLPGGSLAV
jgi:hypothetical protein